MNPTNKRSFTLTELLIAIVLLSTVFLAASSFNLTSYNFYFNTSKYIQTEREIAPALDFIAKSVEEGTGTVDTPAATFVINIRPKSIQVKIDSNKDGKWEEFIDDTKLFYLDTATHQIIYYPSYVKNPSEYYIIANKVMDLEFPMLPAHYPVWIRLTARYDPNNPIVDPVDNPEVILETTVFPRSASIN